MYLLKAMACAESRRIRKEKKKERHVMFRWSGTLLNMQATGVNMDEPIYKMYNLFIFYI